MKLFHGSNKLVDFLKSGTYVTKYLKDAQKFGYRQSVQSKSQKIYIYTLEINKEELKRDDTRDGAYILLKEISVTQVQAFNTYDAL